MSGSAEKRNGNDRLSFPHLKSLVDLEKTVTPVFKGLFRFRRPEQAVTSGSLRHVIHDIQPKVAPTSTFFNSVNQFVDVDIPKNLHYLDQVDALITLTGTAIGVSGNSFAAMPSNLFSRVEVRVGSETKQTVTDLEQWFDQVVYTDPWDQERHQDAKIYSAADYGVGSVTIANDTDVGPIRIPISSFLTKCGIAPATCNEQITLRLYSQVASNVLTHTVALKELRINARELRGDEQILQSIAQPHLDWRFLDTKHEEKVLSLTNGATATWVLNNFSDDDLCSHMWIVVRNPALTGAHRDAMLDDVVSRVWLEDESGHNMTNGIQFTGSDLLHLHYPDKFTNRANTKHGLYLLFCPAVDPVSDYKEGVVTGAQPLARNIRVRLTSAQTGNYHCTVLAMCHKHVRVQGGKVTVA